MATQKFVDETVVHEPAYVTPDAFSCTAAGRNAMVAQPDTFPEGSCARSLNRYAVPGDSVTNASLRVTGESVIDVQCAPPSVLRWRSYRSIPVPLSEASQRMRPGTLGPAVAPTCVVARSSEMDGAVTSGPLYVAVNVRSADATIVCDRAPPSDHFTNERRAPLSVWVGVASS